MYDCASRQVPFNYKFIGKERDTESNLDFFDARYYSSSMGRFMTPDWSASSNPDPVPYASLPYPQSLNLYSYVQNNPLNPRTRPAIALLMEKNTTGIDERVAPKLSFLGRPCFGTA